MKKILIREWKGICLQLTETNEVAKKLMFCYKCHWGTCEEMSSEEGESKQRKQFGNVFLFCFASNNLARKWLQFFSDRFRSILMRDWARSKQDLPSNNPLYNKQIYFLNHTHANAVYWTHTLWFQTATINCEHYTNYNISQL